MAMIPAIMTGMMSGGMLDNERTMLPRLGWEAQAALHRLKVMSRTLHDQVGPENTHGGDTDTSLCGSICGTEAGEDDGAGAAHGTEEGLYPLSAFCPIKLLHLIQIIALSATSAQTFILDMESEGLVRQRMWSVASQKIVKPGRGDSGGTYGINGTAER